MVGVDPCSAGASLPGRHSYANEWLDRTEQKGNNMILEAQREPIVTGALLNMEAPIPAQIADMLRGRAFPNFDAFRSAIWRAASMVPELAREFSGSNRKLMSH